MQTNKIDVSLVECNTNEIVTLYTFNFQFSMDSHVLTTRYSHLYKLHQTLSKELRFKKLFKSAKVPSFPSKEWYKINIDYTKRSKQLLNWFKIIISNPQIFKIEAFEKGINLPAEISQKLILWEYVCDGCQFVNYLNEEECVNC
eukprot:72910_1